MESVVLWIPYRCKHLLTDVGCILIGCVRDLSIYSYSIKPWFMLIQNDTKCDLMHCREFFQKLTADLNSR